MQLGWYSELHLAQDINCSFVSAGLSITPNPISSPLSFILVRHTTHFASLSVLLDCVSEVGENSSSDSELSVFF